jgi:hypothetical protein
VDDIEMDAKRRDEHEIFLSPGDVALVWVAFLHPRQLSMSREKKTRKRAAEKKWAGG